MTETPEPSAMECRQIAEFLGEYLDGTLPKHLSELLEWHIEGCAACVAFVNTYRGTIDVAARLREVQMPPDLRHRLVSMLRSARLSNQPRA